MTRKQLDLIWNGDLNLAGFKWVGILSVNCFLPTCLRFDWEDKGTTYYAMHFVSFCEHYGPVVPIQSFYAFFMCERNVILSGKCLSQQNR